MPWAFISSFENYFWEMYSAGYISWCLETSECSACAQNEQSPGKNNYRPISLLPIFSKIFEKVLFEGLYTFLHSNNLLSDNQSGFRPGDSTINQLLSITHDIYVSFENQSETRAVFLDISKAFDKVWHDGLIYKLHCSGIDGNLLKLLSSFLSNRFQRVVLNGTHSDWLPLKSGVPQGSVLGPLLFLVYQSRH